MRVKTFAAISLAVLFGFVIWLASLEFFRFVSSYFWGHGDSWFSTAARCWVGTSVAMFCAVHVKERVAPPLPERTFVLLLGSCILFATSVATGSGAQIEITSALAGHALAIAIAFRLAPSLQ